MQLLISKQVLTHAILVSLLIFISNSVFADDNKYKGKYKNQEFTQGIKFKIDGKPYYFGGMPVGDDGATDVPGHSWVQISKKRFVGYHKNTNNFWSSTAADGELLYVVKAVIDTWSEVKAANYYARGYSHHHHLVSAKTGMTHPTKIAWLKHVAVRHFELDSGPHPELYHHVEPGVDFDFVPNWNMPHDPSHHMP